jgi:hypothetical protein
VTEPAPRTEELVAVPTRLSTVTVPASAEGTAAFLRDLADRIEAARGVDVLIGLWNTGFGGPTEACFQTVTENIADPRHTPSKDAS